MATRGELMTCSRCRAAPATHSVAFRSGLSYTAAARVCTACLGVLMDVARVPALVEPIDTRPEWLQRGVPARDETGVGR